MFIKDFKFKSALVGRKVILMEKLLFNKKLNNVSNVSAFNPSPSTTLLYAGT